MKSESAEGGIEDERMRLALASAVVAVVLAEEQRAEWSS